MYYYGGSYMIRQYIMRQCAAFESRTTFPTGTLSILYRTILQITVPHGAV